jgi:hypothetical protein
MSRGLACYIASYRAHDSILTCSRAFNLSRDWFEKYRYCSEINSRDVDSVPRCWMLKRQIRDSSSEGRRTWHAQMDAGDGAKMVENCQYHVQAGLQYNQTTPSRCQTLVVTRYLEEFVERRDVCRRRGKQRRQRWDGMWMPKLSQHAHAPMICLSRAWNPSLIHKASSRNFHSTVRMQGDYNVGFTGCSSADIQLTNHDRQP